MLSVAAFPGSTDPRLVDRPAAAEPAAGEVLCRSLQLGICGTDREILESREPRVPPGEDFLVLGHECLARVEAIGDSSGDARVPLSDRLVGGSQPLAVGDLVVPVVRRALPGENRRVDMLALGQFTERGIFDEHGFSAPYWLDRPEYLFRVPAELASVAILTEPLAVAAKGVNEALLLQQARLEPGVWTESPPRVLVTGLGPIAFAALVMSQSRGWPTSVYGRDDPDAFRPGLVRELGGRYLWQREASFDPADVERDGYDLILECTGSEDVILLTAPALAGGGVMVWLGSTRHPQPASRTVGRLVRDGLIRNNIFLGCVNAAPRDFQESLARLAQWHARAPQALPRLITARVDLPGSLEHYIERQRDSIKTVIEYA